MSIALTEFQEAKARLKAREEREVAIIKEKVARDIQPKYAELDKIKAEELNKLTASYNANRNFAMEQYNAQLNSLQEKYEIDKKNVVEVTEKKKNDLLKVTLQNETYAITTECEKAIADLDNLIAKRTEKE